MTRLAMFALLYMTALLLELAEHWRHPYAALATLALVLVLLRVGITRVTFLGFLGLVTAYYFVVQFPDVANHVNIALYCNLLLMAGLGWSLLRRRDYPEDDDAYEMLRPVLQTSMALVYALAGFAKLNTDFLDPRVSCVGSMVGALARTAGSTVAGVPTGLILASGVLLALFTLLPAGRLRRSLPVGLVLVLAAAFAVLRLAPDLPRSAPGAVVLGMGLLVILWELGFGPLLAIPAVQAPVLAFSWSMHATLALIGFVDFGALALTLLLTFVPRAYADLLRSPVHLPLGGRRVQRVHLYFAICLCAGAFSAMGRRLWAGVLFNLAVVVLLWPMLAALVPGTRPAWRGVSLSSPLTPRWLFVFPCLLVLHGLTSYLGLRTAGNFTMFSNLRTEGERSNHLLLGGNQLKHWHYQEDAVRFVRIDDRRAAIGYQYQPLEGNRLPVVEFRKLIERWTRAEITLPMTIEYAGTTYRTGDIVHDPVWRDTGRDWEMRLMDFRVIQEEGPNLCRW